MDKQFVVEWIQLEFFAGDPFGYYRILYKPDGTIEYEGEGVRLLFSLYGQHKWKGKVSSRVFKNLAKILIERRWENEIDPMGEGIVVLDGWTDVVSWSVNEEIYEYSIQIGKGPKSILKVIERMKKLLMDELKKIPDSK